jgi:hypothetical protein
MVLIAMLAAIMIGASWFLMSRLNAASADFVAVKRARNAQVLSKAKQALIGYVAAQANKAGENNPGSLPCPENPADFDSTTGRQGLIGSSCGTTVKVGRLPWRTLGLDKLVDADGEPLWYVVSPNWGLNIASNTKINSDTVGQLTLDGSPAVALIIAPGAAVNVATAANCTAWTQVRSLSGTPDWRNYLECENANSPADAAFVSTGASVSFNDQVLKITSDEILGPLEAAIANRIQREIVPKLKSVYASSDWGGTGTPPVYPFAAPFTNPGTSTYQGTSATTRGLLPLTYANSHPLPASPAVPTPCNPAADMRCSTTFHSWASPPTVSKVGGSGSAALWTGVVTCTTETSSTATCYSYYKGGNITVRYDDRISNIGNSLATFTLASYSFSQVRVYDYNNGGSWKTPVTPTASRTFNSDGSFSFRLNAVLPAPGGNDWVYFEFTATRPTFSDHPMLDETDADIGWFYRNEWYRTLYYAVAPGYAGTSAPACATGSTCLSVSSRDPVNPLTPSNAQRAILILTGRSVNGSARPSSALTDYLELGNATAKYERRTVSPLSTSTWYADSGATNAYVIGAPAIASGATIYFKAASANSGAATLKTSVTAPLPIVNSDGSALSSGQIPANGVVQVTYDATRFVLFGGPFNDRIAVIDSN